jgi:hypothetical protein
MAAVVLDDQQYDPKKHRPTRAAPKKGASKIPLGRKKK